MLLNDMGRDRAVADIRATITNIGTGNTPVEVDGNLGIVTIGKADSELEFS